VNPDDRVPSFLILLEVILCSQFSFPLFTLAGEISLPAWAEINMPLIFLMQQRYDNISRESKERMCPKTGTSSAIKGTPVP